MVFTIATCREAAEDLVFTTELDIVTDKTEPRELSFLRERLSSDRERLMEQLENPSIATAGYLGLDELFWTLRFSWANLQDFIEEANSAVINEERGFRNVPYCFTADGVPMRPRIHFNQTLDDHAVWFKTDAQPVTSWDDEDYRAATDIEVE